MKSKEELMYMCGTRVCSETKSEILPIRSRQDFDRYDIYSATKSPAVKASVKWKPIDNDWKACIGEMFWGKATLDEMRNAHPDMDARLYELRERLLDFAGDAVCLPGYEEDLSDILQYGQFWVGRNALIQKGEPSRCHSNSCYLWDANRDKDLHICTGYALSADGMWRQHSWCIWHKARSNRIVETTEPRVVYYGFVLDDVQAEKFLNEQW